jgi:uncharacterized protein (TIGR02246 family)
MEITDLPQADQEAIAKTLLNLVAGFRERDASKLVGVYSEDADWVNAFGTVQKGGPAIVQYLTGLFSDGNFNAGTVKGPPETTIRVVSPDVVVVSAHLVVEGQLLVGGEAMPDRSNYSLRVLQRQPDGKWFIISEMYNDANQERTYDKAVQEALPWLGRDDDLDTVGEHLGAPSHRRTVATRLPDDRGRLPGDGRLVYDGDPLDDASVPGDDLARLDDAAVPHLQLSSGDLGYRPVRRTRAMVVVRVLRKASACALPRPSATASAKLAKTVAHSQKTTRPMKIPGFRNSRTVVQTLPTSTVKAAVVDVGPSRHRQDMAKSAKEQPNRVSDQPGHHWGTLSHGDWAQTRSVN